MALVLTRRLQPLHGLLDLAPIVTVVLLLLFFFLLSSSFVLQPGIRIEPPQSQFGVGTPLSRLIVAITLPPAQVDANGVALKREPILYFNDQIVTLDDLRAQLDKMALGRNLPSLVIKADKGVTLDEVMGVEDIALAHRLPVILATQPGAPGATP